MISWQNVFNTQIMQKTVNNNTVKSKTMLLVKKFRSMRNISK